MFNREEPRRSLKIKSRIVPILVVILLGVQLFFPSKGWVILLSGFGGMWLVSYIWARALRKGLQINRDMSFGWKQVGDRLRERILLENNSWVPSLWVNVDDHSDMQDYQISAITDVRGWRYRNWHTQGVCNHRGLFTLGPVTLTTEDPFGIYEVSVDYNESVNMMVVPPVVTLPEIDIASGGRVGEGRSSNKGLKQTVSTVGVREYVPGDSLRWLHWPTVARTGELFVHLFENEPTSDWWVLLDMDESVQVGEGHCSTEEHSIMLAASLVNRGIQIGKHVGFITHGGELVWHPPDVGDAHLWSVLRSLATIRPGGPPLDQILGRMKSSLGRNSSLIVITPNLDPTWISALDMLRRLGIIPTVLLMDPVSFGGEGNVDQVRNRLRKLEITQHTITSELLDRPQQEEKKAWDWLTSTLPTGEMLGAWDVFWGKAKRALRTWGLILLFYFVFANLLDGAVRGVDQSLIWFLILFGFVIGTGFAGSKLKGWLVGGLSSIIGIVVSIVRVGALGNKILDASVRFFQLLPEFYSWAYKSTDAPDTLPLRLRLNEIWTDSSTIGVRLWAWGRSLFQGQSFYDPVSITFLWSIAIWGVVIWSIWYIIKQSKPLTGFLPALALVSITVAMVGKTAYDLVFMLGAALALMVLIHHDGRERIWLLRELTFTPGIRKNIIIAAILLSIGLMVFSLITPSVSIDSIADYARKLSGESVGDETSVAQSFGFTDQSGETEIDILTRSQAGGLPNQHLIGSGSELSDQVVMLVKVESPAQEMLEAPLYLRNLVYDKYTGSGWESRGTEVLVYSAGDEVLPILPKNIIPIRQQVQFVEDLGGFLFATGMPLSVDHDFRLAWRARGYQDGIYDILGGTVDADVDTYRVDSFVHRSSVDELRSAGQAYPNWISERYLGLPSTVPDAVLSLAIELTATEPNAYDRAVAIERYLRKIPYSLNVSTGPAGADIVDYFLFRLKKGYCDYYATSMVVLARAAGLPARYVVGYVGEYYDQAEDIFIITADQSHAWPEIFFPGYGWVPFEPTGGRTAMERPLEPMPELPDEFELNFSPLVPEKEFNFNNWLIILGITLFAIAVLIAIVWQISDWWLTRASTETLILKLYKRLYRYGRWARLEFDPGDTAYQFSDVLVRYLNQLGRECYWSSWILDGAGMIRELTAVLVQCMFNPHREAINPEEILRLYKQLRPRLWLLLLLGRAYPYRILRPFLWENAPLIIPASSEEIK